MRRSAQVYLRAHHGALGVPEAGVLILGHMRAGSSLLLHLLEANEEVVAAGERNATYRSARDVDALARDCYLVRRRTFGRARFAVDQLNHDHLLPDPRLLLHPRVQSILLARAPLASIGSIVRTFEPIYGGWPAERAARYYVARLRTLEAYARRLTRAGRGFTFVRYEGLTAAPGPTLARVRAQLDLRRPLKETYDVHAFTGVRGDPSPRILTGRVRADAGRGVELPAAWREAAEAAHQRLCEVATRAGGECASSC